MLENFGTSNRDKKLNEILQNSWHFQTVEEYGRIYFFVLQNAWHFWMMLGSILLVLQNSWHFQVMEKYVMIYFICTNIQSQLIIFGLFWEFFGNSLGILWEFFGNSLEHVGLGVLYMLGITVWILYMISNDKLCEYEKILGLRADRTGQKNDH